MRDSSRHARQAELALRIALAAGILWALMFLLQCPPAQAAQARPVAPQAPGPDAATLQRVKDSQAELIAGADLAGMDPSRFTALLLVETGLRPMDGWYEDVIGIGQISWPHWAPLLRAEGWREDEVATDPYWGALAAGRVLGQLRIWYPGRSEALLVCLYAAGNVAESFKKDCIYSRNVDRALAGLEREKNG